MSLLDISPWSLGAFFAWQETQDDRYELVGGFPAKMMTGASRRHDRIVVNLIGFLGTHLRHSPDLPFTGRLAIETFPGQIRRPDAGIDCGDPGLDSYLADRPSAVFEVLSPSTRDFDRLRKLEEYKAVASMRDVVIIEPRRLGILHVSRPSADAPWSADTLTSVDATLRLVGAGIALPLIEIYDGLDDVLGPAV